MTRVLALAPYPPRTDGRHGGSRAMATSLLALAGHSELGLLYLRRPGEPEADPGLAGRCSLSVAVPHADRAAGGATLLRARAGELASTLTGTPAWVRWTRSPALASELRAAAAAFRPDVVQFEQHVMAQFAASLPVRGPARVCVVHEPGAAAAHEHRLEATGARAALRTLDARAWGRWERRALAGMDGLVAFTDSDRATLARYGLAAPAEVIPLPFEIPPEPAAHRGTEPHTLLFVGDYSHPPNAAAAEVLLTDILPRVRLDLADAALVLVGQHPDRLGAFSSPGATATGPVADVAPYLERAALVLAPLWTGGGMRVKVLHALAAGKAVVATPRAVAGLGLRPGEDVAVADTPAAFAGAITALLRDPAARAAMGAAARRWALGRPAGADYARRYEQVWDAAIARRRTHAAEGA
jgi:glycosyltransferase involved in cell wall biosynthesis